MTSNNDLLPVLSRRWLPRRFQRWRVTLHPGEQRPTAAAEWAGALVLVERGTMEVECEAGGTHTFGRGDLLTLGWLPLRVLRNPGDAPTTLLAVRRRHERPTTSFLSVVRAERQEYGGARDTRRK